jgi:hypothetical protein
MFQLNFPNGNVQTYKSYGDLMDAVRAFGGEVKRINDNTFAFVPKK